MSVRNAAEQSASSPVEGEVWSKAAARAANALAESDRDAQEGIFGEIYLAPEDLRTILDALTTRSVAVSSEAVAAKLGETFTGTCGLYCSAEITEADHQSNLLYAANEVLDLLNQARKPEGAEPVAWQSMDSAPKGAITEDVGCRGESVWFLGRVAERYRAGRPEYIVIKRRGWPNEDSWVCAGETYYMPDFFDAWSPLHAHPAHEAGEVERLRAALRSFIRWGEQQCPCENDLPDPCPLCDASVGNLQGCKAVDQKFPPRILAEARAALEDNS